MDKELSKRHIEEFRMGEKKLEEVRLHCPLNIYILLFTNTYHIKYIE